MSGKRNKPEASSNPPKRLPVHPTSKIDSKYDVRLRKKPKITEEHAPVLNMANLMERLDPSEILLGHKREIAGYLQAGGPYNKLPEAVKQDKEVAIWAIQNGHAYQNLHDTLKQDKDIIFCAVRVDPNAFDDVPDVFKQDEQFVVKAVGCQYKLYEYLPDEMKQKTAVALIAIEGNPFHNINKLHSACWGNKEVVNSILDDDLMYFDRVSTHLREDVEFVSDVIERVLKVVEEEKVDVDDIEESVDFVVPYIDKGILNNPPFWQNIFNSKCTNLPPENVKAFFLRVKKHINEECLEKLRFMESFSERESKDDHGLESSSKASPSP